MKNTNQNERYVNKSPLMRALWLGSDLLFENQLIKTIAQYESSTNPKEIYKLGGRVCRIAERLKPLRVDVIYGDKGAYQPVLGEQSVGKVSRLKTLDKLFKAKTLSEIVFKPLYTNPSVFGVRPIKKF